jgi:hypothetical protein
MNVAAASIGILHGDDGQEIQEFPAPRVVSAPSMISEELALAA